MDSASDESRSASFPSLNAADRGSWCLALLPMMIGAGIIGLLAASGLAVLLRPISPLTELWLAIIPVHGAAFGAVIAGVARLAPGVDLLTKLELRPPRQHRKRLELVAKSLLITACFYPANLLITGACIKLLQQMGLSVEASPVLQVLAGDRAVLAAVSVGIISLIIAPIAEEVIFRLVLFESLGQLRVAAPEAVTALLFALLHGIPAQIPGLFLLGLILQHARRSSGGLLLPVAIHMLFNGISVLLALLYY